MALFSTTKPAVHLVNFGQTKKVPPEDVYSIMVWTPKWAQCSQSIPILAPSEVDLVGYKNGTLSLHDYQKSYEERLRSNINKITPLALLDNYANLIPTDAYLCCVCSKDKAQKGQCHRVWAAQILKEAGWIVTLDGRTV